MTRLPFFLGLGLLAGTLSALQTGDRLWGSTVPQCVQCGVTGNSFPNTVTCVGTMTEQMSCTFPGNTCVASGTVCWSPAATPNSLDPNAPITDGLETDARGGTCSQAAANFDVRVSYSGGPTITSCNTCPNSSAMFVQLDVLHFPVTSTNPCSTGGTKVLMTCNKSWTCQ